MSVCPNNILRKEMYMFSSGAKQMAHPQCEMVDAQKCQIFLGIYVKLRVID